MANTDVVLRDEMGLRISGIPQVTIKIADSVTFSVEPGADSALYFSPATAAILSPKPDSRVDLPSGHSLTYTFETSMNGDFGVIVQSPQSGPPQSFDFGSPVTPPALIIQSGQDSSFTVPVNPTQTRL